MASGILDIDLGAIASNWRTLDRMTPPGVETAAVVKADGYGLGAARLAEVLMPQGVRRFFVALTGEGVALRRAVGPAPEIHILSGHMAGDGADLRDHRLTPILNSAAQVARHLVELPGHPFGIQLETGMNRLGIDAADWAVVAPTVLPLGPRLIMSHLAGADDPGDALNERQLQAFRAMTDGLGVTRSLAATGGILLGRRYDFDLTRPGVGLYAGMAYEGVRPVVRLSLPVIQVRTVATGEAIGYSSTWRCAAPTRVATIAVGYADGLPRTLSSRATLWHGDTPCPLLGRVSMDLITVDVTAVDGTPEWLDILGPHQGLITLAEAAGTISYEILTSLGPRYLRRYDAAVDEAAA